MFILAMQQISDYYENYVSPVPDFESDGPIKMSNGVSNISGPVILLDRTNITDNSIKTEQLQSPSGHTTCRRTFAPPSGDINQDEFVMKVKRCRVRLGFTQADVGISLGALYEKHFSQTTVCRFVPIYNHFLTPLTFLFAFKKVKQKLRFESQQLSSNNMKRLVPILRRWISDVESDPDYVQRQTAIASEQRRRKKKCTIDLETKSILAKQYSKNPNPTPDQINVMARSFDLEKQALKDWFRTYNPY